MIFNNKACVLTDQQHTFNFQIKIMYEIKENADEFQTLSYVHRIKKKYSKYVTRKQLSVVRIHILQRSI